MWVWKNGWQSHVLRGLFWGNTSRLEFVPEWAVYNILHGVSTAGFRIGYLFCSSPYIESRLGKFSSPQYNTRKSICRQTSKARNVHWVSISKTRMPLKLLIGLLHVRQGQIHRKHGAIEASFSHKIGCIRLRMQAGFMVIHWWHSNPHVRNNPKSPQQRRSTETFYSSAASVNTSAIKSGGWAPEKATGCPRPLFGSIT